MFCQHKNSYLQLVCSVNPKVINKAVDQAMMRINFDPRDEPTVQKRLDSMQPSLYAPHVDITRARLGFGRVGLRLINRGLHSPDYLTQLQAVHSVLDQVQISENAMFLINLNCPYRVIDLLKHRDPIIREQACIILTHLSSYYQGRNRILSRPSVLDDLLDLITRDRNEIRYAAAMTLSRLARERWDCEIIMKNEKIVENLIKMIKNDYTGIVLLHLKTLERLAEWDPVPALKSNAFQVMKTLFLDPDWRIVQKAMDCMTQLCKHEVGKLLADENDLTFVLMEFLVNHAIEVVISAVGIMQYTTLTTRSKWRAKETVTELSSLLTKLCVHHNMPLLQLRCLQILINLCDIPDMRNHIQYHWEGTIKSINLRTHEEWDGTSETTSYGLETGHNYRTRCIEKVETIKNELGEVADINVHSYMRRIDEKKQQLIKAMNWKSYLD